MRDLFATPEQQPENKGKGKDEAKERAEDKNTGKETRVSTVRTKENPTLLFPVN